MDLPQIVKSLLSLLLVGADFLDHLELDFLDYHLEQAQELK